MSLLAGCLLFGVALGGSAPETVDLVPPGKGPRLRLEITVVGQSPVAVWGAFLDRWFDYFDRDANGWLSRAETSRIFALPVAGRSPAAFDFDKADADKDGKVTRDELKAFYRRAGFTPVQAVVRPPSLKELQVAEALFRHLGPDKEGKLTAANLKHTARLLNKLDENEDEVLTEEEVLSLGVDPKLKAPKSSDFRWAASDGKPAMVIRVVLDTVKGPSVRGELVDKGPPPQLVRGEPSAHDLRLTFAPGQENAGKAAVVSSQFLLAQFKNSVGKKKWLTKSDVEDDASLQLLTDLFAHADRDGDGKLTFAELEQFLALIEQGVRCPLVVTLSDNGRSLFGLLDANGDGRLDLKELHAAAVLLPEKEEVKGWLRKEVPHQVRITLHQGLANGAFGPLPLNEATKTLQTPVTGRMAKGPAWFRAMDRNGDGFLSFREFLGPAALFRKLDSNGDGLISVEEAEKAK